MYKIIISINLFLLPLFTQAQNLYLTQNDHAPLLFNPAQVATSDEATLMLNYRKQLFLEGIAFQTTLITGSYPLMNRSNGKRWGGIGVAFMSEHSNDPQLFRSQGLETAFAYNFNLSPRTHISWGAQGSFYQKSFTTEGITTGSQYVENRGFDPAAPMGENMISAHSGYFSATTGAAFYRTGAHHLPVTHVSLAVHHLNKPQESWMGSAYHVPLQYVVQGKQRIYGNQRWTVTPEVLWVKQQGSSLVRAGTRCNYSFQNNNPLDPIQSGSVDFGVYYLDARAIAFSVQLNQPDFTVGFSYDFGHAEHITQNATELAVGVKKRIVRRKPVKVVKDYSIGQVRRFYEKPPARQATDPATDQENESRDLTQEEAARASQESIQFSLKKTFQFAFNDASLTPEAKAYFDGFINLLELNPALQLKVIGHTDDVGKEKTNIKISLARAQAVKDYLISQGVAKSRVMVEGRGSAEPFVPNDTAVNRGKNRRVELIIYK